mmetsp:Transcript_2594/g.6992  ORF Transcript_2594/g.6992 Transcript_2594/m.6992 type:complete len:287 (-) Transcript_2594:442-1302(-)
MPVSNAACPPLLPLALSPPPLSRRPSPVSAAPTPQRAAVAAAPSSSLAIGANARAATSLPTTVVASTTPLAPSTIATSRPAAQPSVLPSALHATHSTQLQTRFAVLQTRFAVRLEVPGPCTTQAQWSTSPVDARQMRAPPFRSPTASRPPSAATGDRATATALHPSAEARRLQSSRPQCDSMHSMSKPSAPSTTTRPPTALTLSIPEASRRAQSTAPSAPSAAATSAGASFASSASFAVASSADASSGTSARRNSRGRTVASRDDSGSRRISVVGARTHGSRMAAS